MTYRHLLRWPRTGAGQALVERGGGLCHRFVEISHLPVRRLLLGKDKEDPETYHHELFFRMKQQRGKVAKHKQTNISVTYVFIAGVRIKQHSMLVDYTPADGAIYALHHTGDDTPLIAYGNLDRYCMCVIDRCC